MLPELLINRRCVAESVALSCSYENPVVQERSKERKGNYLRPVPALSSICSILVPKCTAGAPHVGEEVSRPRLENGRNATTPVCHEIPPGSGGTYSKKFRARQCPHLILLSNSVPTATSLNHAATRFCFGRNALPSWPVSPNVLTIRAKFTDTKYNTYFLWHPATRYVFMTFRCLVTSTAHLLDVLAVHPRHLEHAQPMPAGKQCCLCRKQ